jgi:hypothetical protein
MKHLIGIIFFGLAAGFFSAAIHTLDSGRWARYIGRFRKALRMAGISDKEARITMGISDPAQFSRQMSGQERLAHSDTMLLPDEFHRCLAFLTLNDLGLPGDVQQAQSWLPGMASTFDTRQGDNS